MKKVNCKKAKEQIEKLKELKVLFDIELERVRKDGIAGNIWKLKSEIEEIKKFF